MLNLNLMEAGAPGWAAMTVPPAPAGRGVHPACTHALPSRVGHAEEMYTVVAPRHPSAARVAVASGFGHSDKFKAMLSLPQRSSEAIA